MPESSGDRSDTDHVWHAQAQGVPRRGDDGQYDVRVIQRAAGRPVIDRRLLREAVRHTLKHHACRAADISVSLVSDARIAQLNRLHLGHDGPTDVITLEHPAVPGEPVCGDIFLSVDTAQREAEARGLALTAEAALYAVHGTLHLLGYDDQRPADARRMHAIEDRMLADWGLGPVYGGRRAAGPRAATPTKRRRRSQRALTRRPANRAHGSDSESRRQSRLLRA